MKYKNKFIAAGIGIAIASTGTYFSYSLFVDSGKLSDNTISIGELVKSYNHKTEARIEEDRTQLEIDLPNHLRGYKYYEVKATTKTGEFSGNSQEELDDKKEIDIDYSGKKIDINKVNSCDYIIVEIKYKNNKKDNWTSETYKITFDKKSSTKLNSYWTKQGSTLTIESDEIEEGEVIPPESGEEVNPSLPGGNIKPIAPPSDEAGPSDEEDKPSTEEKPSEPETNKPSTEEGTQKPGKEPPKEEKPEVVEPPKPELQPDTPTPMPLDE
ncbi:hypothetical protein [Faecalimicrobium sp. JNUCC 81]